MTAASVLDEASNVHDDALATIASAESRATSLQSTVSIAASLVVAGGALLVDPTKIDDRGWRIALLIALGMTLLCLIGCAWRALAVTGRDVPVRAARTRTHLPPSSADRPQSADVPRRRAPTGFGRCGGDRRGQSRSASLSGVVAVVGASLTGAVHRSARACVATESTAQPPTNARSRPRSGTIGVGGRPASGGALRLQRSGTTGATGP